MKALVFDAYGTLFDVHSVIQACEREYPGQGASLSRDWRAKQLEYTWLRALMHQYEDFSRVTAAALEYTCRVRNLPLNTGVKSRLMDEYFRLQPFPEVRETLAALAGRKLLILSNGSPHMLDAVVENAGLKEAFAHVLSVHSVKTYKPSPAVYQLAATHTKLERAAIGFVSSNFWDICGAGAFGFHTYWVNRSGATPDALGYLPDATLESLAALKTMPKV
ncbi:MAG TPA: haloacid dehalogenase type II [Candidatus Acidoferrales bacterium]|nr:haloacid dehalogenase type II [Candidatus Acidoferrales bacterium]